MRIPPFLITLFALTGSILPANAQNRINDIDLPVVQQLHKIKLSLLGLTYQWEKPVSRKSVITLEGGVAGGMSFSAGSISGTAFSLCNSTRDWCRV